MVLNFLEPSLMTWQMNEEETRWLGYFVDFLSLKAVDNLVEGSLVDIGTDAWEDGFNLLSGYKHV